LNAKVLWANTGKAGDLMENKQPPHIGIIAEDDSDCKCLSILIKRITKNIITKGYGVGGGGNMFNARKMERWTKSLYAENYRNLLIVHDLDRDGRTSMLNDRNILENRLKNALVNNPILQKKIIIPIEEIEAWLLSEDYPKPETIVNPKQKLRKANKNYRTADNEKIAQKIDIAQIAKKCPSFMPLKQFVESISEAV
jgi:hypothetical protein